MAPATNAAADIVVVVVEDKGCSFRCWIVSATKVLVTNKSYQRTNDNTKKESFLRRFLGLCSCSLIGSENWERGFGVRVFAM